ncbi:flagellar protein FliS [Acidobacteria bacterium AB60]|nr:flagellar protein FliS [Acidobacteria bacterium AB60]
MSTYSTELSYRKTAAVGASGVELVIALYDTLAGDMGRAIAAMRKNDIPARSKAVAHALQVLGYLVQWINGEQDAEFARNLSTFYAHLQRKLLEAQANQSIELLEEQIKLVLTIRRGWQDQLDAQASKAPEPEPEPVMPRRPQAFGGWQEERASLSWSA